MAEAKAVITSRSENARAHLVTGDAETTLCNKPIPARRRRIDWDGGDSVPTGTYSSSYICRTCKARASGEKQGGPRFTKAQALALHERAHAAGKAAAEAATPTPMIVQQRAHPLGDLMGMSDAENPVVKEYPPVMGGVCGFAWVNVRPGNGSFARHLKLTKSYYGGADQRNCGQDRFDQSYERAQAAAGAYAAVIREAGITAYPMSRLD